ncbi:MAG TPA: hypothetical protein VKV22_08135 [Rhodanobacteraceae bacterium]|nr:hypothetical protein [Rhodanobacteraceae bacterium]
MRYEELSGPLEGWTYDEHGTIYTASGYRCNARDIEFCLWMRECMTAEAKRYMIRSDEAAGALRPLYELADVSAKHQPTRLRLVEDQKRVNGNDPHQANSRPRAPKAPRSANAPARIKSASAGLRPTPQEQRHRPPKHRHVIRGLRIIVALVASSPMLADLTTATALLGG